MYSLALEAYRNSQGPEAVCEEATGGARVMKTRFSHGNTRYLQMAMRIAAQQSRIPVTPIVDEPDLVQDSPANLAAEGASPPEEVCSPTASEQGGSDAPAGEAADAKSATVGGSARAAAKPADVSEHFADDFFPVQNEARTAERHSLATPVLTRKERKRRARLLAGLRRK